MPDHVHQSIVEAIEAEPELALELVSRSVGLDLPRWSTLEVANASLSDTKPATAAADVVIRLRNDDGTVAFVIVAEVQLRDDEAKEWAWPVYWALIRRRERAPTMLLVIAGDEATARWASRLLRAGDPHEWHPVVAPLSVLPRITDEAAVAADPVRAVVSALGHLADAEVVGALWRGLPRLSRASLPSKDARYYLDLIVGKALALVVELLMKTPENYEPTSEIFRKWYGQGKEEGLERGREEGRRALREHLRTILAGRRVPLSASDDERIENCTDIDILGRWLSRAMLARSAADVFVDV